MWFAEVGLYHYKARAHDPKLGRFLQTDPIGYAAGLNLYAYVGNDPVIATDPSGLLERGFSLPGSCGRERVDSPSGLDEVVSEGTRPEYPCLACGNPGRGFKPGDGSFGSTNSSFESGGERPPGVTDDLIDSINDEVVVNGTRPTGGTAAGPFLPWLGTLVSTSSLYTNLYARTDNGKKKGKRPDFQGMFPFIKDSTLSDCVWAGAFVGSGTALAAIGFAYFMGGPIGWALIGGLAYGFVVGCGGTYVYYEFIYNPEPE